MPDTSQFTLSVYNAQQPLKALATETETHVLADCQSVTSRAEVTR